MSQPQFQSRRLLTVPPFRPISGTMAGLPSDLVGIVLASAVAAVLLMLVQRFLAWAMLSTALKNSGLQWAPGSLPLVGHALALLQGQPYKIFDSWLRSAGQLALRFRVLDKECILVRGPAALKRVFQTKAKQYGKDKGFTYHPFMGILGSGLVTSDGDLWQKQRLLIGPALRIDILDNIVAIAHRAVRRLGDKLEASKGSGQPVDMEDEFRRLTLQVIGEAILSLGPEECDAVFPALYLPVMEESHRRVLQPFREYLPVLPEWWLYRWRMSKLNGFIIKLLRSRRDARAASTGGKKASGSEDDILDRILDSVLGDEGTVGAWSHALEQQLCYEIKTFLLAGHETTAETLTWSLYELSMSKSGMARVQEEAAAVFGASSKISDPPSRESCEQRMSFTVAVLKETLRKYSVVPVVVRVALKDDDDLCGYRIKAGARIMCCISGTHDMWEEPQEHRPERFLPGGEYDKFDDAERPYMFVPFIQGPRNCLGQHLALLEARVVLAELVARFTFSPADPEEAGKTHPWVIPVGPANGMHMLIS